MVLWLNGWTDQDETWHAVGLGPGHNALDGDPAPPPQWEAEPTPQFLAHICCGQMAARIKMPLGMEVALGPGNFVLDGHPAPPPQKGNGAPHFGRCLLWPNGWTDQDGSWQGGRPQPRQLYVRLEPSTSPKRGSLRSSPIFGPFLLRPNGWMHQDATWYGGRPWPRRHCVRCGPSSTLSKKGAELPPQFSAHVYCDQTARWIKMPLGMEVGLGPDDIVLDRAQLPQKGHGPQFLAHVCCGQTVTHLSYC